MRQVATTKGTAKGRNSKKDKSEEVLPKTPLDAAKDAAEAMLSGAALARRHAITLQNTPYTAELSKQRLQQAVDQEKLYQKFQAAFDNKAEDKILKALKKKADALTAEVSSAKAGLLQRF